VINSCPVTFSLLSLLPLPPDDLPSGEAVGGEHIVGEVSDEHIVGEFGEVHIAGDGGEHALGEVDDVHIVGEVLADAGNGEVSEQVVGRVATEGKCPLSQSNHHGQGVHCR
jgi:hypothetical protein